MVVIDGVLALIHMQKCAGTSVARAVIQAVGDQALYWGYDSAGEARSAEWYSRGLLWKHSTAFELKAFLPEEVWERTPKVFMSLRNTKDRMLSHYAHLRRYGRANFSFRQFLGGDMPETVEQYITDRDGRLLVDHVLTVQDLGASACELLRKLGIAVDSIPYDTVNEKKSELLSDVEVTPDDMQIIESMCKWELDQFAACR